MKDLVDAVRYRLGAFSGHLVRKRRQFLALFAQHLELLVRMRRPEFDDIRWRLGGRDLLREIENRLDVSPSHIDHLEVKGTDVFQRDGIALFDCSGRLLDCSKGLVGSRSALIGELLALIVFGHRTHSRSSVVCESYRSPAAKVALGHPRAASAIRSNPKTRER